MPNQVAKTSFVNHATVGVGRTGELLGEDREKKEMDVKRRSHKRSPMFMLSRCVCYHHWVTLKQCHVRLLLSLLSCQFGKESNHHRKKVIITDDDFRVVIMISG
jgi:hypothetical protein